MDLLFGALVSTGARTVLKALVAGDRLGRDDLAELTVATANTLLTAQEAQGAALARIERDVARGLRQDFNREYKSGLVALQRSGSRERSPADQREQIEAACDHFRRAAAGSEDLFDQARALHAAAAASLLAGRPGEAKRELEEAWTHAYSQLVELYRRLRNPPVRSKLTQALVGGDANAQDRWDVESKFRAILPVVIDVNQLRQFLGASPEQAPVPDSPSEFWSIAFQAAQTQPDVANGLIDVLLPIGAIFLPDGFRLKLRILSSLPPMLGTPRIAMQIDATARGDATIDMVAMWPVKNSSGLMGSVIATRGSAVQRSFTASFSETIELVGPTARDPRETIDPQVDRITVFYEGFALYVDPTK
jgi:hypothetical protein